MLLTAFMLQGALAQTAPEPADTAPEPTADPATALEQAEEPTADPAVAKPVGSTLTHVIYAGFEPALALEQAAAATGLPASSLRAKSLADLKLQGDPMLNGPGSVQSCTGIPSTMNNVRGTIQRAENAVAYMEFDNARVHLRTAMMALSCLEEPLEPESAGRIYFLEGVVLDAEGSLEESAAAFQTARTFDPTMEWDHYFPPNSKPLFDEIFQAEESSEKATLSLLPAPGADMLWVDGAPVQEPEAAISLRPGVHAIQVVTSRVDTAYVTLEPGQHATLVLPDSIPDSAISWVGDDKKRGDFSAILGALMEPGQAVLVVTGGQVWAGEAGGTEWEVKSIPTRLTSARSSLDQRRLASQSLLWGGGGIAVASGAYAGISWIRALDAQSAGESANGFDAYAAARSQYMSSSMRYTLSGSIALTSMVISGIGWWLRNPDSEPATAQWDAWGSEEGMGLTWTTVVP